MVSTIFDVYVSIILFHVVARIVPPCKIKGKRILVVAQTVEESPLLNMQI
jgi:hypothetical protein